jgi:hypothetical protein
VKALSPEVLLSFLQPHLPGLSVAITRNTQTQEIFGITLVTQDRSFSMGVQVLDPQESQPVKWQTIDEQPVWSEANHGTTGLPSPYQSYWISYSTLHQELWGKLQEVKG